METKYKFCPKCWNKEEIPASEISTPLFCTDCGTEMVDWTLTCECGAIIRPSFRSNGEPYDKYCKHCSRPTAELAKQEAVDIKVKLLSPIGED